MHPSAEQFIERVKLLYPASFIAKDVLDVGSLDINGNNRHHFYAFKSYTGIDVGEGPNVDLVIKGDSLPFEDRTFDAVISTECMEHNRHYEELIPHMVRVLKPGGIMVMTMAGFGRPEHGTAKTDPAASPHTHDYYMNLMIGNLAVVLPWEKFFFPFSFEYAGAYDLYFYGIKKFE